MLNPRRSYLTLLAIGLALFGALRPQSVHAADAKRPNVIFIFTDDHAAHAMSCYGSKINQTPNLDRIAREGTLFQNCFCTNSICGPSRAVILTGKHSHLNGFKTNEAGKNFNGAQQTFPKLLQSVGYQTAMIGKWHLGSDPTGFDYWDILNGQGPYYNPPMTANGKKVQRQGYTTEVLTDLALDWLEKGRDREKPFMLMWQHKAPHREWQPGPKQFDLYKDVKIPEPETLFDDYSSRGTAAHEQDMTLEKTMTRFDLKFDPPKNLTADQLAAWHKCYDAENAEFEKNKATMSPKDIVRWRYQRYIKDYLRCVAAVDDAVGHVLKYLDDHGLAENTVVIYSSDQGFYLGDHGWFDKRFMYEPSLRMPLLVRWPGATKPGSINTNLVQNLDFAATFLELAGAKTPADMQGRSLVPLFKGQTPTDWRKSIYYHYYEYFSDRGAPHAVRRHYGVRTDRYKLIHFYNEDEWELFDLQTDPNELQNLYGDPAQADRVRELKTEVARLQKQYQVPDDRGKLKASEL